MIEKKMRIVNGMTGEETPVRVAEKTTPTDVMEHLGFDKNRYALSTVHNRRVLPPGCSLDKEVRDGERLFLFARIEVGEEQ